MSVAGVARRQNRRAAHGAGVVGAGAAAVGTAAAVAERLAFGDVAAREAYLSSVVGAIER
jgi:hypothetical protein